MNVVSESNTMQPALSEHSAAVTDLILSKQDSMPNHRGRSLTDKNKRAESETQSALVNFKESEGKSSSIPRRKKKK